MKSEKEINEALETVRKVRKKVEMIAKANDSDADKSIWATLENYSIVLAWVADDSEQEFFEEILEKLPKILEIDIPEWN